MDSSYQQVEDFVFDQSFRNWVMKTRKEDKRKWEAWIVSHPEFRPMVHEASAIVRKLEENRTMISEEMVEESWKELEEMKERLRIKKLNRYRYLSIAASIVIFLIAGMYVWIGLKWWDNTYRVSTGTGETLQLTLADGTEVIMNESSSLTAFRRWEPGESREVRMKGEMYFHVTETSLQDPFYVMVDSLRIDVLGTAFTVSNHQNNTRVVLNSGKVQVLHTAFDDTIQIERGELTEFDTLQKKFLVRKVNAELYSSWVQNLFVLNQTPLHEIIEMVEDRYEVSVSISNKALLERELTGEIETRSASQLFETLSLLPDLNIRYEEDSVWIYPDDEPLVRN